MSETNSILDNDFIGPDKTSEDYKYQLAELKMLKKKVNRAGNFLFAIGLITIITRVAMDFENNDTITMIYYSAIGAFYIGMGFLATIRPVIGLSLALLVYICLFILLSVLSNGGVSNAAIYIRIIVSIILIVGIINAVKIEQLQNKMRINDTI
ncbi:MAG: hypothetical protein R2753_08080 [Chitinophagales bacterium]